MDAPMGRTRSLKCRLGNDEPLTSTSDWSDKRWLNAAVLKDGLTKIMLSCPRDFIHPLKSLRRLVVRDQRSERVSRPLQTKCEHHLFDCVCLCKTKICFWLFSRTESRDKWVIQLLCPGCVHQCWNQLPTLLPEVQRKFIFQQTLEFPKARSTELRNRAWPSQWEQEQKENQRDWRTHRWNGSIPWQRTQ